MSHSPAPYSAGYNFGGSLARRMEQQLRSVVADNKRRVPCGQCGLSILPENMNRHHAICHDDGAA